MATVQTPYGDIHYGGTCQDHYPNIELYDQPPKGGAPIKLQRPALRAFREAERRYGRKSVRWRWRKYGRPIPLTGSWRSCAYQRELYASDSNRYAHPDATLHPRGLAIDVRNDLGILAKRRIRRILAGLGWKQVRPDDEPWHWSYFLRA